MYFWSSSGGVHILSKKSDVYHPIYYDFKWILQKLHANLTNLLSLMYFQLNSDEVQVKFICIHRIELLIFCDYTSVPLPLPPHQKIFKRFGVVARTKVKVQFLNANRSKVNIIQLIIQLSIISLNRVQEIREELTHWCVDQMFHRSLASSPEGKLKR